MAPRAFTANVHDEIPDELVKLTADATTGHHLRSLRSDKAETCTCGKVVGGRLTGERAWEEHYAELALAAVTAAIQAQTLRDFADWLDKQPDHGACADLAREQADLIAGASE